MFNISQHLTRDVSTYVSTSHFFTIIFIYFLIDCFINLFVGDFSARDLSSITCGRHLRYQRAYENFWQSRFA